MLQNHNLQFTNATRLNDPFDTHPSMIDFSNVPANDRRLVFGKGAVMELESHRYERLRDRAWICSLSKVYNSNLMWAYYCNHQGICIGIDMEKTDKYLSNAHCKFTFGTMRFTVQYKEILKKPDYFHDSKDYYQYQLSTKGKEWEHEQEVRLVLIDPSYGFIPASVPKNKKAKIIDCKEMRFYPQIGGECFDSLYLGVRVEEKEKQNIIETAKMINPDIKIYQMTIDSDMLKMSALLLP